MQRKSKKKKKPNFTLMILPHSNSVPLSIKVPRWLVNGLAVFSILSVILVTFLIISYYDLQETIVENEQLKTVNNIQSKEIKKLQVETEEVLSKLNEITQTDAMVRALVGLKEDNEDTTPSRSQGGLGLQGRKVQTLALNDIDLINSVKVEKNSTEKITNININLTSNNDLDNIAKIKYDLAKINEIMVEQEDVLAKLEVEVKDRLDYLSSVPSGWPVRGRITSDFGWRRNPFNNRTWEHHGGIDIAASYGTSIKAAGDGQVIFSGWKPVYGYTVIIKHGYGYTSQYSHNSRLNVKAGQNVERGDIIARLGSTGRSTGPHVHFGISYNGQWIDPKKVLK